MNKIELSEHQILIFTNGVYLRKTINYGYSIDYELVAGRTTSNIKVELTISNIESIEKDYNIRLLGVFNRNSNYEKILTINNGILFDSENFTKQLSENGFKIREFVINKIFGSKKIYDDLFDIIPLEIEFAGLDQKHFLSKDKLSHILNSQKTVINHKCLLYFDVQSVIDDAISQVIACEKRIINIGVEQYHWLENNQGVYGKGKEFTEFGLTNYKLNALYSDCIIGLRSCLDLISKLYYVLYELKNYTGDYSSNVKLHYSSKYYSNAKEISKIFGLSNTIFELTNKYEGLGLIRNALIHNSFISPIPQIFRGNGTPQVNNKDIDYMICFMWDLEKNKPVIYKNRKRFFSQQNQVDKFILNQYLTLMEDIDNTMNLLINKIVNWN